MESAIPRRVLVTGAGSGLGRSIAATMAGAGDQVIGTVRSPERARLLTVESKVAGPPIEFRPLELTDSRQIGALAASIEGPLDVLVLNAGMGVFGSVEELGAEETALQFAANLLGPLELAQKLLPGLRERRGRVIWIGSMAGRFAMPFQAHYSATKSAIAAMSDAMRLELAPHGVKVTCVEPGDFATNFTRNRLVPRVENSPYSEQLAVCLKVAESQETGGPGAEWVGRLVHQLSRMKNPPARRPVGRWARTLCWLRDFLPDSLREAVVRQMFGM